MFQNFVTFIHAFSVRPVIKVPNPEISVLEGEDAVLECEIEAYPKGVYYWELDTGKSKFSPSLKAGKPSFDGLTGPFDNFSI